MEDAYKQKYEKYKSKYLAARRKSKENKSSRRKQRKQRGGAIDAPIPDVKLAIDETYFWGKQFQEHMEIFNLGLEVEPLKSRGKELCDKWDAFLKAEFEDKGIPYIRDPVNSEDSKVSLDETDFEKLGDLSKFNFDKLTEILQETKDYKTQIKEKIDQGDWIGWVHPAFVDHLILEFDMYHKRIQGKVSDEEDIAFYVKMSQDHVAISEKLTDPNPENEKLEERMWKIRMSAPKGVIDVDTAANYVKIVDEVSDEILKMIVDKHFKGIKPTFIGLHECVEHKKATQKLKEMRTKQAKQ